MPPTINHQVKDFWRDCDICGFKYPLHQLRRQDGLYKCVVLPCYDRLGHEHYRAQVIFSDREGSTYEVIDEASFAKE